jgi:DNA-binding NtrC family response regulator
MAQTLHTRLLLCSRSSDSVLALQREILRNSGYEAVATASKEEIQDRIENADFDVIILNHTLSFADRKALARKTKQRNPNCGVMVLHHSGPWETPAWTWPWTRGPACSRCCRP